MSTYTPELSSDITAVDMAATLASLACTVAAYEVEGTVRNVLAGAAGVLWLGTMAHVLWNNRSLEQ